MHSVLRIDPVVYRMLAGRALCRFGGGFIPVANRADGAAATMGMRPADGSAAGGADALVAAFILFGSGIGGAVPVGAGVPFLVITLEPPFLLFRTEIL